MAAFLKVEPTSLIKSLVYMADDIPVMVLLRGDRILNEVALKKLTGATELFLAREGQVQKATGAPTGLLLENARAMALSRMPSPALPWTSASWLPNVR